MASSRRGVLPAALAVALIVLSTGSFALAHSELAAASPSPGAIVGGSVTRVDLIFAAGVSEAEMSLTGPDDLVVPGSVNQAATNRLIFELDEDLEVEGQYILRYKMLSEDGDRVELAYAFSYRADAPAPLPPSSVDEDGFPWLTLAIATPVALVVAALALQTLRLLRRSQRAPTS